MRRIYLIRHGQPFFPDGGKYCIGSADFPLDRLGRLQACQTAYALKGERLSVFTSPLRRAYDTACFIAPSPTVIDGLREMDAGEWDGLSFGEISRRWAELFLARAENTDLPIPGSEDWEEGQARFISAVEQALGRSEGDIAIVAHTTVILSFICRIMESTEYRRFIYRPDYGGYYVAALDEGKLSCEFPWRRPQPEPDGELCRRLLAAAELPEHVAAHCEAVAEKAAELCRELNNAGLSLDEKAVYHAALLHDIARLSERHAETGAEWLSNLGYGKIAAIVRQHHEPETENIDEAAVVYIADKLIQGTKQVPLRERFEKSREKCLEPEALAAHERREAQAAAIASRINSICKKELII